MHYKDIEYEMEQKEYMLIFILVKCITL